MKLSKALPFLMLLLLVHGCARVPKPSDVSTPTFYQVSTAGTYHTVERGQTLYRISKIYQVDVSELMRVNHVYSPTQLTTGQRLWIPRPIAPSRPLKTVETLSLDSMRSIVGPVVTASGWKTITLHHSATRSGNARLFDRDHRRRRMGGLFYHFVIGNGTKSGDGAVEVGWRWKKQADANRPRDIQICLVGNFNEQQVSEAQFNSLLNLVAVLQEQYHIPSSRIRRHDNIKGRHTECPGKNFPLQKLLNKLA